MRDRIEPVFFFFFERERERELSKGQLHGFNRHRLRQLRIKNELSPEELAASAGVDASSVRYWESGRSLPTPESAKKFAARFGVKLTDLLDIDYGTCLLPALRSPAGLSQGDAARALGWHKKLLSRIECGDRPPTADEQRALADLYGIDPGLVAAAARRTIAARAAKLQEEP